MPFDFGKEDKTDQKTGGNAQLFGYPNPFAAPKKPEPAQQPTKPAGFGTFGQTAGGAIGGFSGFGGPKPSTTPPAEEKAKPAFTFQTAQPAASFAFGNPNREPQKPEPTQQPTQEVKPAPPKEAEQKPGVSAGSGASAAQFTVTVKPACCLYCDHAMRQLAREQGAVLFAKACPFCEGGEGGEQHADAQPAEEKDAVEAKKLSAPFQELARHFFHDAMDMMAQRDAWVGYAQQLRGMIAANENTMQVVQNQVAQYKQALQTEQQVSSALQEENRALRLALVAKQESKK